MGSVLPVSSFDCGGTGAGPVETEVGSDSGALSICFSTLDDCIPGDALVVDGDKGARILPPPALFVKAIGDRGVVGVFGAVGDTGVRSILLADGRVGVPFSANLTRAVKVSRGAVEVLGDRGD